MFTDKTMNEIETAYQNRLSALGSFAALIETRIDDCTSDLKLALKYLYSSMPISDTFDYSFDIILDFARHGIWLRKNNPYSRQISDRLFLDYVLMHRINNESIEACRSFFHADITSSILAKGIDIDTLTMEDAAIEINYWCAEHVTYQAGDDRTASPLAVYRSGIGRCGEESAFTVSALRSFGLPARQVYAPRWSHCDDNHAWVEVWIDGDWHFMGACEPEPELDRGWFVHAAARAMLIHSRTFGQKPLSVDTTNDLGSQGIENYQNQLSRYADVRPLKIKVTDEYGTALSDIRLDLCVLNYAEMYPIASLKTNSQGEASFDTACGSLLIHAVGTDMSYRQHYVERAEDQEISIVFSQQDTDSGISDKVFTFYSPQDTAKNSRPMSEEIRSESRSRLASTLGIFRQKQDAWRVQLDQAIETLDISDNDKDLVTGLLHSARSNWPEILSFIEADLHNNEATTDKINSSMLSIRLLQQLSTKDLREYSCQLLLDHLIPAMKESTEILLSMNNSKKLFDQYVLSPRIGLEPITSWRLFIDTWLSSSAKLDFKNEPARIYNWLIKQTKQMPELCGPELITSPASLMKHDIADIKSIDICFVAICRSLGIPARLDPVTQTPQFWKSGSFVSPTIDSQRKCGSARLVLKTQADSESRWIYRQNWSLAALRQGAYQTLELGGCKFYDQELALNLIPGKYRLITCERMPNGNQLVSTKEFTLTADQSEVIEISKIIYSIEDIMENTSLSTNNVIRENTSSDSLTIMLWLEAGREPTEHILNELCERASDIIKLDLKTVIFSDSEMIRQDHSTSQLLKLLPRSEITKFDYTDLEALARRVYRTPDMLPLILAVMPDATVIYSASGYNVGTADIIIKLAERVSKEVDSNV